jgi:D-inositol-3-phosphate glycosyltransferase
MLLLERLDGTDKWRLSSLRIALISYHTSPLAPLGSSAAGGMNLYVRKLAEGLGRMGIAVDVFTRRDAPGIPLVREVAPNVHLYSLPIGPPRVMTKVELAAYALPFGETLAALVAERGLSYDVIHSHYWLSGLAALRLHEGGQPLVHMFHTLSRVKRAYQPDAGIGDAPWREDAEIRLLHMANVLVLATSAELEDVRRLYGFSPAHVAIIPPGVDQNRFVPSDAAAAQRRLHLEGKRVVLFVGRMDRAKGIDMLLSAAARLRRHPDLSSDLRIVIVGGDDNRRDSVARREVTRLKSIAHNLHLSDIVEFRGVIPQEQLPLYYAAADVCAIPSLYESFGMVALEAMACGRPVVGFKARGLEQTVQNGRSGLLVAAGDVPAFAAALEQVLLDRCLARRFGIAGREAVRQFTWDAVVERSYQLYQEVASGRRYALAP